MVTCWGGLQCHRLQRTESFACGKFMGTTGDPVALGEVAACCFVH